MGLDTCSMSFVLLLCTVLFQNVHNLKFLLIIFKQFLNSQVIQLIRHSINIIVVFADYEMIFFKSDISSQTCFCVSTSQSDKIAICLNKIWIYVYLIQPCSSTTQAADLIESYWPLMNFILNYYYSSVLQCN